MTARKGLNTITSSSGVVLDITNKLLDTKAIADFPEFASTANGKGASLVGIEDSGGLITATTVEGALAENRALIDSNSLGLGAFWECVYVIADSNVTLSGEQTIDGETTSASRVLLTAQTDASENGLWLTAAGAWSRTNDADADSDYTTNKTVCAMAGSRAGQTWAYTGDSNPVLDTDDLTFTMKSGSNIADGSVTTAKLADDAVTSAKILDDNVTQAKLADDSVGEDQLIDGSVVTAALADGAVTTAKILDNNITVAKMAPNSVDSDQYVDGSIDAVHLASDSVVTAKILDDNVTTAKIADANITLAKMAADSVDSDQYVDGSIDTEHFSSQAENNKVFVTTIDYDSGASNTLIASNPSGAHVLEVMVKVTTAFDGTSPTLDIGVSGDTDAIAPNSDIDLTNVSDVQVMSKWYTMASTTDVLGTLAVSGATQGSCQVAVRRVK